MSSKQNVKILFSIKETAQKLGFAPVFISHLIDTGELDFVLPPGRKHKKISLAAIEDFIKRNSFNHSGESIEVPFYQP